MLKIAIGAGLRSLRSERNLTMRDVADKAKVSIAHISEVERGEKNASSELLEALADSMDVSLKELLREIYFHLDSIEDSSEQRVS